MVRTGLVATMLALILAAPAVAQDRAGRSPRRAPAAVPAGPVPPESRCIYLVRDASGVHPVEDPNLHVLDQTAADGQFAPTPPPGAAGIQCWRNSIVPGPHDEEVILARLALLIFDATGSEPHRVGALDFNGTQFRYVVRTGTLTPAEQAAVDARLAEFLVHVQARGAAH